MKHSGKREEAGKMKPESINIVTFISALESLAGECTLLSRTTSGLVATYRVPGDMVLFVDASNGRIQTELAACERGAVEVVGEFNSVLPLAREIKRRMG